MVEKFSRDQEIQYVKTGLISAITTVNLKIEESPDLQPYYESGKKVLDHLVDKESLIHTIAPKILEENTELIEEARNLFPESNSLDLLLKLLKTYSKL